MATKDVLLVFLFLTLKIYLYVYLSVGIYLVKLMETPEQCLKSVQT